MPSASRRASSAAAYWEKDVVRGVEPASDHPLSVADGHLLTS